MILTLYDRKHNVLRPLVDVKDMHIDSVLSTGDKTLSFLMPGSQLKDVYTEAYISTADDDFVIKSITPSSNGWYQIRCNLNAEELESYLESFESVEKTMKECLDFAFVGTGWHVGICEVKKKRTIRRTNTTPWKIMQDARKTYRAEIKINSKLKTVDIYERIGEDKGIYFAEQLNLKQLNKQTTSYDFFTQIKPIGADGLTIESINDGNPILSNHTYSDKNKLYVWVDQRYTVIENLKADAAAKLAEMSTPLNAYALQVIDLAKISDEYKDILSYGLGDTVSMIHASTGTAEKTRIVSMVEYPNEPHKNKCEVANSVLKFEDIQQEMQDAADIINNITRDDGTVDGKTVDSITTSQISDFDVKVQSVVDLKAIYADIKDLKANSATIQDLAAAIARIGTLEATSVTTVTLQAEVAKLNKAIINKADITDLTAVTGKVNVLESDVATLDTIINRVTTSDSIHSLVINASTAVVDRGFFKSLVSTIITVNDLLAGDISTTRFKVKSDSGNLLISDNTIQIKDATRVRVQLGKDAGNDYSLSLWDAAGNLIWDARGLKAAGIKDAIIRNDMVSKDANIDGSKINISSVVTEINNGTTTINSSHILYDGKSLDVAFNSMETSVTTVTKTVTDNKSIWDAASANASTALSKATSVESRANSGEFDGKGVNTTSVTYQASANGVTAPTGTWQTAIPSVGAGQYLWTRTIITYTDKTSTTSYSVSKMGVNGSTGGKGDKGDTGNGISTITTYYLASASASGVTTSTSGWSTTPQSVTSSNKYHWSYQVIAYTNGSRSTTTPAIIGVYGDTGAKGANGATGATGKGISSVTPQYYLSTSNTTQTGGSWKTTQDAWSAGKYYWSRDAITWSDNTTSYTTPMLAVALNSANANASNALTQVTTVTETVKTHSTQLGVQDGKISTLITDTTQTKKDIATVKNNVQTAQENITILETNYSSLEQTVGGLSTTVGSHSSSISTVTKTVNDNKINWDKAPTALDTASKAKTVADSASSTASTAKSTADSAASTASTAKSAADQAKTDASTAKTTASSAVTTANTAKSTADAAKSTATTASTTAANALNTANDARSKIDGLQIGGRNYIILSKLSAYGSYNTVPTYSGDIITTKWASSYTGNTLTLSINGFTPKAGVYTLSGYLKVNGKVPTSKYFTGPASTYGGTLTASTYDTTTGKFVITQRYPGNSVWILHAPTTRASGSTDTVTLEKLMFEEGNKATSHTIAPEDIDNRITTEIKTVKDRQTSFETTLNGITGRVSSVESTTTTVKNTVDANKANWDKAPTALNTANTAKTTADSAASTASTAKTTADQAKSTATSASTTASTAKSTADTAKSTADAAKSTATTASTNATNALNTANTAKSTADAAKSTATLANTNADKALTGLKVVPLASSKLFKNVASYSNDSGGVKGAFVIVTPITPSHMCRFRITGYNYTGATNNIDVTITCYNYDGSIINHSYTNEGNVLISSIRLAKVSATDKRLVIILGGVTDTWQYPKLCVETALVSYSSLAPDSWKDGWSISLVTTLSTAYVHTVTLAGLNVQSEITTVKTKESNLELTVDQFKTTVSSTYATKTQLTTVDGKFASYATVAAMNSAITAKANEINLAVSKTYATQTSLGTTNSNVSSLTSRVTSAEQKITDTAIVSTVTKSSSWSTLNTKATDAQTKANNLIDLTTVKDTRSANNNPQWYYTKYAKKTVKEFKTCTTIGITGEGTYGTLVTEVPWTDTSGGFPNQLFYPNNSQNIYRRVGTSTTAWSAWTKVAGTHNIVSSINQTAEAIKIQASKISLEGIITANSRFKILADGSMVATNGTFTGVVNATSGTFNGTVKNTGSDGFYSRLENGSLAVGKVNEKYGELTASWSASDTSKHYLSLVASSTSKAIKIGQQSSSSSHIPYYVMNFGDDPDGHTQRHHFYGDALFNSKVEALGGYEFFNTDKRYCGWLDGTSNDNLCLSNDTNDSQIQIPINPNKPDMVVYTTKNLKLTSTVSTLSLYGGWAITANKNISISSDVRLKHDIQNIDVTWLDDLEVKSFVYNDNIRNDTEIGIIANGYAGRSYAKYFLDMDNKGYYSVRYQNITNALIQYSQELKQRIVTLENERNSALTRNYELLNRMQMMEMRINTLEQRLQA